MKRTCKPMTESIGLDKRTIASMSISLRKDLLMTRSGVSSIRKRPSKLSWIGSYETPLRYALVRAIKQRWPNSWVYHPSDKWRSGIPDLLCCIEGRFLAIEVKRPEGTVAPIQAATLTAIRRSGGTAWVLRAVKELCDVHLP